MDDIVYLSCSAQARRQNVLQFSVIISSSKKATLIPVPIHIPFDILSECVKREILSRNITSRSAKQADTLIRNEYSLDIKVVLDGFICQEHFFAKKYPYWSVKIEEKG